MISATVKTLNRLSVYDLPCLGNDLLAVLANKYSNIEVTSEDIIELTVLSSKIVIKYLDKSGDLHSVFVEISLFEQLAWLAQAQINLTQLIGDGETVSFNDNSEIVVNEIIEDNNHFFDLYPIASLMSVGQKWVVRSGDSSSQTCDPLTAYQIFIDCYLDEKAKYKLSEIVEFDGVEWIVCNHYAGSVYRLARFSGDNWIDVLATETSIKEIERNYDGCPF
jgi:hypothetical protein